MKDIRDLNMKIFCVNTFGDLHRFLRQIDRCALKSFVSVIRIWSKVNACIHKSE